jgi:hypothetical protein
MLIWTSHKFIKFGDFNVHFRSLGTSMVHPVKVNELQITLYSLRIVDI